MERRGRTELCHRRVLDSSPLVEIPPRLPVVVVVKVVVVKLPQSSLAFETFFSRGESLSFGESLGFGLGLVLPIVESPSVGSESQASEDVHVSLLRESVLFLPEISIDLVVVDQTLELGIHPRLVLVPTRLAKPILVL